MAGVSNSSTAAARPTAIDSLEKPTGLAASSLSVSFPLALTHVFVEPYAEALLTAFPKELVCLVWEYYRPSQFVFADGSNSNTLSGDGGVALFPAPLPACYSVTTSTAATTAATSGSSSSGGESSVLKREVVDGKYWQRAWSSVPLWWQSRPCFRVVVDVPPIDRAQTDIVIGVGIPPPPASLSAPDLMYPKYGTDDNSWGVYSEGIVVSGGQARYRLEAHHRAAAAADTTGNNNSGSRVAAALRDRSASASPYAWSNTVGMACDLATGCVAVWFDGAPVLRAGHALEIPTTAVTAPPAAATTAAGGYGGSAGSVWFPSNNTLARRTDHEELPFYTFMVTPPEKLRHCHVMVATFTTALHRYGPNLVPQFTVHEFLPPPITALPKRDDDD